jgi:hypothetical protein
MFSLDLPSFENDDSGISGNDVIPLAEWFQLLPIQTVIFTVISLLNAQSASVNQGLVR